MEIATSLIKRIKERKSPINIDINARIRVLQRKFVEMSFSKRNNTKEYFKVLGEIKALRNGDVK